jgi:hypothetical protein
VITAVGVERDCPRQHSQLESLLQYRLEKRVHPFEIRIAAVISMPQGAALAGDLTANL